MATKKKVQPKKQVKSKRGGGRKTPPLPLLRNVTKRDPQKVVLRVSKEEVIEKMNEFEINPEAIEQMVTKDKDGSIHIDVDKQTMDSIMKPEVELKKASEITPMDDLKFEMGRLRTHFDLWSTYVEYEGNLYYVQVDPLNKLVKFLGHGNGPDEEGKKVVEQFVKNNGVEHPQ